jgi:alkylation response protein AidB-like acyl-CoA dehydrogenase
MDSGWVRFSDGAAEPPSAAEAALAAAASDCDGDPAPVITLLRTGSGLPPLRGNAERWWRLLATLASLDLTAARTVEPHLDALGILDQAGIVPEPGTVWGVFAAESPDTKLVAADDGRWKLEGTKPWCSLAGQIDRAIVTAHVDGGRRAFAVDLRLPQVRVAEAHWHSRGLRQVPSGPVHFDGAPAEPVGSTGWYLERPGFAAGGIGVAACWFGGAIGLYRSLRSAALRREPDQLALAWLGEADRLLAGAAALLADASRLADGGTATWIHAHRVRGQMEALCRRLLDISGQAGGPQPLAFDEDHARRAADLGLYIRQHHAARDDAALGRLLLEGDRTW